MNISGSKLFVLALSMAVIGIRADKAFGQRPQYGLTYGFLAGACHQFDASCVLDLTARRQNQCEGMEFTAKIRAAHSLAESLDAYIAHCDMYRWKKEGNVYVVEPANPAESALGFDVGPVKGEMWAYESMMKLLRHSEKKLPGPDLVRVSVPDPHAATRKAIFDIPRTRLKAALVLAARQIGGPSYWMIRRESGGTFAWVVEDFKFHDPKDALPAHR